MSRQKDTSKETANVVSKAINGIKKILAASPNKTALCLNSILSGNGLKNAKLFKQLKSKSDDETIQASYENLFTYVGVLSDLSNGNEGVINELGLAKKGNNIPRFELEIQEIVATTKSLLKEAIKEFLTESPGTHLTDLVDKKQAMGK